MAKIKKMYFKFIRPMVSGKARTLCKFSNVYVFYALKSSYLLLFVTLIEKLVLVVIFLTLFITVFWKDHEYFQKLIKTK